MTEIQIAFPKVDTGSKSLVLPSEPEAPVSKGLAVLASTPETRATLSCRALLQGETLARAEREAADLLTKMLENPQITMTYGLSAMEDIRSLIEQILREGDPVKIAGLTKLMQEMNDGMREVEGDFNMANPKVREKFENWKGGIGRFIGQGKTMIEMLMESVTPIEKQLDKTVEHFQDKQLMLQESAGIYREYYKRNEEMVSKLIYVIGVMEIIRDMATQQASEIVVGNSNLGDRGGEQQAQMADFVSIMNRKIATYTGQLWIAWSNAPRLRMMQTQVSQLVYTIHDTIYIGIPSMKACIVDWREAMKAQEAAEANEVARKSLNHWLQQSTAAVANAAVTIAEEVQTPPLTPETVFAMAKSIDEMSSGIVQAIKQGAQQREALNQAITKSKPLLDGAATKVSDEILNQVLNDAAKLEIATSVA